jgi:hypothetical protein
VGLGRAARPRRTPHRAGPGRAGVATRGPRRGAPVPRGPTWAA